MAQPIRGRQLFDQDMRPVPHRRGAGNPDPMQRPGYTPPSTTGITRMQGESLEDFQRRMQEHLKRTGQGGPGDDPAGNVGPPPSYTNFRRPLTKDEIREQQQYEITQFGERIAQPHAEGIKRVVDRNLSAAGKVAGAIGSAFKPIAGFFTGQQRGGGQPGTGRTTPSRPRANRNPGAVTDHGTIEIPTLPTPAQRQPQVGLGISG